MNKIFENVVDYVKGMKSINKLILSIIAVVVLYFLVKIISNISFSETMIDYKNTNGKELVQNSAECKDRDVYVILNDIVENFLAVKIDGYKIDNHKVTLKDFYNYALYDEFKVNMSYFNFKSKAQKMYSKIYNEDIKYKNIPLDSYIDSIYTYSNALKMYIVKINTNNGDDAYIGIKLEENTNNYSIFYIE